MDWYEYIKRRPIGWREDYRSAVIALSFGGGKDLKPSDLFPSIKVVEDEQQTNKENSSDWAKKLMSLTGKNSIYDTEGNLNVN